MVKSKTENKKPAKATSPYAKQSKKAPDSIIMEPSTPSTQGTNMSTEDLDANISEVGQKLGVSRKLYDEADDMSVDDVKIPRKVNAKKLTKVCYTPPKKIIVKQEVAEVVFLGSRKPTPVKARAAVNTNKYYKRPLLYGFDNIQISRTKWAHILGIAANGFSEENDRPRTGFHSFVLRIKIKDEKEEFFTDRGVFEESIIDMTLADGTLITEEDYSERTVTSFVMYSNHPMIQTQLAKTMSDFLAYVNALTWRERPLASRASLLTPSPWLKHDGIGEWIGLAGVQKLVTEADPKFTAFEYWANQNQKLAATLWKPGKWTLTNAAYFGADPEWLDSDGKISHALAQKEEGPAEGSDQD